MLELGFSHQLVQLARKVTALYRALFSQDGDGGKCRKGTGNVHQRITKSLLGPSDKAEAAAAKHNENKHMAEDWKIQCVLEEHFNEHARDGQEGRIAESEKRADQSLEHAPLRTRRMEIHSNRSHHVFAILMAE
ncbi:hypothetical protein NUU61_003716 [Penicillium alfredii]|uniref:Uncharacterized protein n=1 Tax=Penicillium alfredii TaxID=1506179 RepID=A0A9W9FJY7_9EURO|nr:uncharacterized protein NUU61_003716 [Penicillium alfredii]KAJ5101494.1 hypothetical protein NUU61_003716 [Penicillium alfredii]